MRPATFPISYTSKAVDNPVATSGESGVWFGWAGLDSAFSSGLLLGAPHVAAGAEPLAVARVVGAAVGGADDVVGLGRWLPAGVAWVVPASSASADGVALEDQALSRRGESG